MYSKDSGADICASSRGNAAVDLHQGRFPGHRSLFRSSGSSEDQGGSHATSVSAVLAMHRGAAGVAMADADCHASLSDYPGGRAGRKHLAPFRPQPLVDCHSFYPTDQLDRLMGLCLQPMALS